MGAERILIVRLGAMGDIVHALPAAAFLRRSNPGARVAWLVERKWLPLLEGNPNVDEVLVMERGGAWQTIRSVWPIRGRFDVAYDLQGLLKSAIPARLAAGRVVGSVRPREAVARCLLTEAVNASAAHIIDQNMQIVGAAETESREFWLPLGKPEGSLPNGAFVLASPEAGWRAKQWPRDRYEELRQLLAARNIRLVLNGMPGSGLDHESGIAGLIDATRRATAVVGVDSGPLHIAAALGKPGVAIFGPTDPARNGPYAAGTRLGNVGSIRVLRAATAVTSYRRSDEHDSSMLAITATQVFEALGL